MPILKRGDADGRRGKGGEEGGRGRGGSRCQQPRVRQKKRKEGEGEESPQTFHKKKAGKKGRGDPSAPL